MAPFNAGNAPSYQDLSVKKPIHRARRRGSIRLQRHQKSTRRRPARSYPRGYRISGAVGDRSRLAVTQG